MDLVVNHTSDEHPWFVESRDPGSAKRDWYWWRPARGRLRARARAGAEPTNWASAFSGSAWQLRRAERGVLPAPVQPASSPTSTGRTRRSAQAVYAMMHWWVDRGVDGFRMDVINLISKQPELRDGASRCRAGVRAGVRARGQRAAAGGVPGRDEPRGRADRPEPADRRRDAGIDHRAGPAGSPTRRAASSTWSSPSSTSAWTGSPAGPSGTSPSCSCPVLKRNLEDWQIGLAEVGWNSLYWDNHDQPRAVSRFGDDSPEHRVELGQDAGHRAAPAQGHAVRLPGRRAGDDQHLLRRASRSTATSSR